MNETYERCDPCGNTLERGQLIEFDGQLLAIANSNGLENLYIKHDGSLDDGMELVSHPMSLQMVDRICDVALYLSDEELKAMSWTTFVSGCTQPELVHYLKERRLYVNEPVTADEEV